MNQHRNLTSHIDGLAQGYSNPIANTLELLQACTKPSICSNVRTRSIFQITHTDSLMQKSSNSVATVMELWLFCIKPSI